MVPGKVGCFFIWRLKKFVCLKQCPLYSFHFRDMWEGSILKTDEIKGVCPSQQGLCFRAWPIYTSITVHCFIILCKYFSLSYKTPLQWSELNTYQFVLLFQWLNRLSVWHSKKKVMWNSNDIPDQITGRKDNTLRIPSANSELKYCQMFITYLNPVQW